MDAFRDIVIMLIIVMKTLRRHDPPAPCWRHCCDITWSILDHWSRDFFFSDLWKCRASENTKDKSRMDSLGCVYIARTVVLNIALFYDRLNPNMSKNNDTPHADAMWCESILSSEALMSDISSSVCIHGGPKMAPFIVRLITSPNINRFLKFFHCQNQKTICNKTVTIDLTTPKVCHYTTSWNVRWRTQAGDATD